MHATVTKNVKFNVYVNTINYIRFLVNITADLENIYLRSPTI